MLIAATIVSLWQAISADRARAAAVRAFAAEKKQRVEALDQRDRALKAEGQAEANLARATSEEAKAKQSAEEAQGVLFFLRQKVVAAARSKGEEGGLGQDVTLRAAIDAAESSIATDFKDNPTIEAAIRETLGESYRLMGDPALSLRQVKRSWELRTQALGPDHRDTLTSMTLLAAAYWETGRVAEAISLQEEVFKRSRKTLGPLDMDTLRMMNNLGLSFRDGGRLDDAIALHEEAVKLMKTSLGPDHRGTLMTMANLALEYWIAGRLADAISLHEETDKRSTAVLGPDHPDTLTNLNHLAAAYREAGRNTEAIAILEKAVPLEKTTMGPGHPETLIGMGQLAFAYEAAGRTADAIRVFEESVQLYRSKLGPDYPGTASSMNYLADLYLKTDRWQDAERLLRECLTLHEKHRPDNWIRFHTMSQLGAALSGQKQYADAEPLLLQGYEGLKSRESKILRPMKDNLISAAARIVPFYEAWGKNDKASEWRAKLKPADVKTKQSR